MSTEPERNPRVDPRSGDRVMLRGCENRITRYTADSFYIQLFRDDKYIGWTACNLETWRRWNEEAK